MPGAASSGATTAYAPWVNNFDVRLSQELPGFLPRATRRRFVLDILNFGNLLNKKWGRIDEIGFPSHRQLRQLQRPGRQAATSTAWARWKTTSTQRQDTAASRSGPCRRR